MFHSCLGSICWIVFVQNKYANQNMFHVWMYSDQTPPLQSCILNHTACHFVANFQHQFFQPETNFSFLVMIKTWLKTLTPFLSANRPKQCFCWLKIKRVRLTKYDFNQHGRLISWLNLKIADKMNTNSNWFYLSFGWTWIISRITG